MWQYIDALILRRDESLTHLSLEGVRSVCSPIVYAKLSYSAACGLNKPDLLRSLRQRWREMCRSCLSRRCSLSLCIRSGLLSLLGMHQSDADRLAFANQMFACVYTSPYMFGRMSVFPQLCSDTPTTSSCRRSICPPFGHVGSAVCRRRAPRSSRVATKARLVCFILDVSKI